VTIAAALSAAGCGTVTKTSAGRFNGESRAVAQKIDDLSSAGSSHEARKVCDQILSRALVARLNSARGGCQDAVRKQLEDADNFELTVQSVAVSGQAATAQVKSPRDGKDRVQTMKLVRESGGWRVAGLG
jgi:ribosomal protein L14E/L6E/L27E